MENEEVEYDDEYHYAVDIPKVNSSGKISDEWHCVEYFKTKEEAIAFAKFHLNADDEGNINVISSF